MSKKLNSKLLSIILAIAICCATLCGSLIAAHAAAADFNGTYTISVGDDKQAVPFAATEVKAQVKFDLPAGFVGGQFKFTPDSNYTVSDTIKVSSITTKDGSAYDIANIEIEKSKDDDKYRFIIGDGSVLCTSITFDYTIVMNEYAKNGTRYPVGITFDADDLVQFSTYDFQDVSFAASPSSISSFHVHGAWYDVSALTDVNGTAEGLKNAELSGATYVPVNNKDGKHTVASSSCSICEKVSYGPYSKSVQLIPDYTEFDGAQSLFSSSIGWMGISGTTVNYEEDGTIDVNVHAYSLYKTDIVYLLVTDAEGNEIMRTAAYDSVEASSYAGDGLVNGAKMFTLTDLSARDIDTDLLLTLIAVYDEGGKLSVHNSRTQAFNIADYCLKVVEGDAIWSEGATDDQINADKDLAAALYYYGASIQDSVFDKNTAGGGSTSGIEYVNANYDEWDGTTVQPTKTDSEGNIVISTAEELAWIALEGAANTANKNYKVVDNSVFNMKGMDGITINSTAAQVETAGKARIAASQWSADHNWRSVTDSNTNAFVGNFDGNGLVVYNIFSRVYANAGLFPCTNPAVQGTQTIKNVAVYASFMSAYHYSGGIVGLANAPSGTGYTMKFDSCATKNSYIDDMSSSNERTTGTIVGGLGHNTTVINNCLALNNKLVSTGIIGGFFGNTSNYGGDPTVSNSLSIGSTIAPTSVGIALGTKVPNTTYTNVYDEDVDAATLGSAWFNTTTYPELSIFHKLSKQYVDENTHKVICVLKAGGNACTLKGVTEEHTLLKNAEGNAKVCECGYSVPVYKDIEYITANYDEWDGTTSQPTETDSEGNIIIRNAEQLAWIALEGAANTANKNYKVVDNSVFNMKGMDGITMNSTAAQVETAGKARVAASQWSADHNWRLVTDNHTNAFVGNFDGNGLVVYNIFSRVYAYAGLFPCTNPAVQGTQTIKNVAVYASFMSGYHYSGGIVGNANAPSGTGYTMKFDSCATKNSYIDDMSSSNERTTGTIVGGLGHNTTVINNCLALNNKLVSTGIIGGFFGNTSNYGGDPTVSNSLSIGSTIAPTSVGVALGSKVPNTTYTNVYDEDVDAATLGSAWFNTTTYPELSIFHKMTTEYVNDSTHKSVCTIVANGINCTVCGTAEEHTFTQNVDKMECTCGYYEFVIGNRLTPTELNYDEWDGTFTQPTAQDTSGNIIITTAEELAWIALRGATATNGVNYKVADNTVFNMMGMSGINMNSTVDEVKAAAKNNDRKWQTQSDTVAKTVAFAGNFDGNGVIVYNIYTGTGRCAGGLFPAIYPSDNTTATIKNVAVMASHFGGYHYTGAIIGQANAGSSSTKLVLEGAVVKNCYIYDNNDQNSACQRTTGTLVGHLLHTESTINNCLVVGNEVSAQGIKGGLFGNTSIYGGANKVSNTVSIGTAIESVSVNYAKNNKQVTYTNVHSSNVSAAQLGDAWFDTTTTTYPELKIFHDMQAIYEDENTHKTACGYVVDGVQCKVCGTASNHELVINAAGTEKVCACGIKEKVVGNVVVPNHVNYDEWDGTRVQPTKTDSEGNIIISTAEELAWIALEGSTATNDINYKAVANSVFNMKGMDGITLNSTADDIKAASKKWQMRWVPYVDGTATDTGNVTFGGNFDGNGLTVYNISGGAGGGVCYQGLFPVLKQSANGVTQEIKNVQIVASYFVGYHNAGALIGSVPAAPGTDCKLNIENISVKNCYITDNANTNAACSRTVGVIAGNVGHNKTTVNNCFAINNELVATNIYGGLIANTSQWSSGVVINNSVVIGTPKAPIDILDDGKNIETPAANTTYTNVHTDDVDAATLGSAWFDTTTYPELKIFHDLKTIYIDENTHQTVCQHFVNGVQCSVSQAICGHTMVGNADNTYTECECGFGYEIKGIHAMNLPACILERITNNTIYNERFATNALFKAAYSADVFGTDVQENVFDLYATSLNLKVNPHIAFTFAFHGDYKTNKANITATFSVEGQNIATVTGAEMINNAGAGRYHLYRFKALPVSKLCKPVTVTVTYGGSTYDFGTYSAAGYAINAMNAGADYQEHVNASMALVYYSEMLAARQSK